MSRGVVRFFPNGSFEVLNTLVNGCSGHGVHVVARLQIAFVSGRLELASTRPQIGQPSLFRPADQDLYLAGDGCRRDTDGNYWYEKGATGIAFPAMSGVRNATMKVWPTVPQLAGLTWERSSFR